MIDMMYIVSLIISFSTLILSIIMTFLDPDSRFFNYFGDTEIYFCMGVSVAFMILGFIKDFRSDHQNE